MEKLLRFIQSVTFGLLLACLASNETAAYPPAPHHTIYGQVRDEWGNPINAKGEVYLETLSGTKIKSPILTASEPGVNYQLQVPMDSGLTADVYKPTALRPTVPFRMVVRINGVNYLPLETKINPVNLGQPGKRTRLDLTLGEDSDGDGLPDAWERALLAALGKTGLDLINPGDDSDKDGLKNLDEYLAGTYAFDPEDSFELKLASATSTSADLEFTALRGRTYTILHSTDMKVWAPVQFIISGETTPRSSYQGTDVRLLRVQVPSNSSSLEGLGFFKLIVQ